MLWLVLSFLAFVAAAVLSRTRHAGWALTRVAAGLALALVPQLARAF